MEVVQGQALGLVVRPSACAPLDRLADPRVQLPPTAVGEPLVGRVADQRVAEPEHPGLVFAEELLEAAPEVVVERRNLLVERLRQQAGLEAGTEDRCYRSTVRSLGSRRSMLAAISASTEPGSSSSAAPASAAATSSSEEERISPRPLGERLEDVGRKRDVLGR